MSEDTAPKVGVIEWDDFLTNLAPPVTREVAGAIVWAQNGNDRLLCWPVLSLYCGSASCGKTMLFDKRHRDISDYALPLAVNSPARVFAVYACRHCGETLKTFALIAVMSNIYDKTIRVTKLGEVPNFAGPVPANLRKLLGTDAPLFYKGLRCESQGLGIGAMTYYRRVVDSQKDKLLDRILDVARMTETAPEGVQTLERAKAERDFSRSVDAMKDAFPVVLRYRGQNPMLLLNSALGRSIHEESDEECLALAGTVRLMLGFIVERIALVLSQQVHLDDALATLQRKHEEKKNRGKQIGASVT